MENLRPKCEACLFWVFTCLYLVELFLFLDQKFNRFEYMSGMNCLYAWNAVNRNSSRRQGKRILNMCIYCPFDGLSAGRMTEWLSAKRVNSFCIAHIYWRVIIFLWPHKLSPLYTLSDWRRRSLCVACQFTCECANATSEVHFHGTNWITLSFNRSCKVIFQWSDRSWKRVLSRN